ncbi:MAG: hypothetical protein COB85_05155 [Bacteroidetes bacterium]|nr:MAG: hypothetical protein COB85_05155 [Bacteroidota bacterium]
MKKYSAIAVLFLLLIGGTAVSQQMSKGQMAADAELYFKQGHYHDALLLYEKLDSMSPDIDIKFKLGICYLEQTDKMKQSIPVLEKVLAEKPKIEDLYFYLARAYAVNYRFDDAIKHFQDARGKKISKEKLESLDRYIAYCETGKRLVENPIDVKIENIGRPVNTKGKEYVPVVSADEGLMIFTYRGVNSTGGLQNAYAEPDPKGQYYEDVFQSVKLGGDTWSEPERIGENINTHGHDASLALSANGEKLFIYKDTEGSSGDIYVSELEGYTWSLPVKLDSNINTDAWEGNVSLSADENTLYFSSEREGGYGMKDIYRSDRKSDGSWGKAVNLGSKINSAFDDQSPYIHPDGKTLFFSSEGGNSMGGSDIFRTIKISDTAWTNPENIGYPINTTGDDLFYVVSADGERGYYSSAKVGGYGQHDIYVVHLGDEAKKHQLILIKGIVTANDKVAEAKITVEYANTGMAYDGFFKSNSATGKYIVILPGGSSYNLTFNVDSFEPHLENVDASSITGYKEIERDVKLYSSDFVRHISVTGNIMTGEAYVGPGAMVMINLANEDGSISLKTRTDDEGNFKFEKVPSGYTYTFSIADASIRHALVTGVFTSGEAPKSGIEVSLEGGSQSISNADGKFKLELLPDAPKECPYPIQHLDKFGGGSTFPDLSDAIYKKIMDKYGDCTADGLIFQVQIGAYYTPDNFNYSYFNELGNVTTQLLKDGITRFVVGRYRKMNEAEALRNKAVKIGDRDAFIVIYYKGDRMMVGEAITKEF